MRVCTFDRCPNLLFFFFAEKIYTKFSFSLDNQKCEVHDILLKENRVKSFPLIVELIKKGDLKLNAYIEHIINPTDYNIREVNEKISMIVQAMKTEERVTEDMQRVIQRIKENDHEWIKKNMLQ